MLRTKPLPAINYLWIGPPTYDDTNAVAGHDVAAAIAMARQLQRQAQQGEDTNPIKFWCLREHEKYYREFFAKENVEIEVCSVETLLEDELKVSEDPQKPDNSESARFLQELLSSIDLNNLGDRVMFKDGFSLFLWYCKSGYLFDTNIFPSQKNPVSLPFKAKTFTARSLSGKNDFYMMYSSSCYHPDLIKIFNKWKSQPGIMNVQAFKEAGVDIPVKRLDKMGIIKRSYNSYLRGGKPNGLFYWLERHSKSNTIPLADFLIYGDINQQIAYPGSMKVLEKVSLGHFKHDQIKIEDLIKQPCKTDKAYVEVHNTKTTNSELYYLDFTSGITKRIYKKNTNMVLAGLPSWLSNYQSIGLAPSGSMQSIMGEVADPSFNILTNHVKVAEYFPSHIVNIDGCTLLHHAVLSGQLEQVRILIEAGANLNLEATYELRPKGIQDKFTPLGLARFLKEEALVEMLSKAGAKEKEEEKQEEKQEEKMTEESKHFSSARFYRKNPIEKEDKGVQMIIKRREGAETIYKRTRKNK